MRKRTRTYVPSDPPVTLLRVTRTELQSRLTSGLSLNDIATEFGVHPSTVGYWTKKHNLRAVGSERFRARGEPNRAELERLALECTSLKEIAAGINRSVSTVRYWLRKWQIERPRRARRADPATAPPVIERHCSRHGTTRFRLEGRGYYRCMICRQERVSEWRRRVKRILVSEAGGECRLCGYARCVAALQFHHLDRAEKRYHISQQGIARNLTEARAEAQKCVLLCANCHAEVESGLVTIT